jgi:hypothetical protein
LLIQQLVVSVQRVPVARVFRHHFCLLQFKVVLHLAGPCLRQHYLLLLLPLLVLLLLLEMQLQLGGLESRQLQWAGGNGANRLPMPNMLLLLLPLVVRTLSCCNSPGQASSSSSTRGFLGRFFHGKHDPISAADTHRATPDVWHLQLIPTDRTGVCVHFRALPSDRRCAPAETAAARLAHEWPSAGWRSCGSSLGCQLSSRRCNRSLVAVAGSLPLVCCCCCCSCWVSI